MPPFPASGKYGSPAPLLPSTYGGPAAVAAACPAISAATTESATSPRVRDRCIFPTPVGSLRTLGPHQKAAPEKRACGLAPSSGRPSDGVASAAPSLVSETGWSCHGL